MKLILGTFAIFSVAFGQTLPVLDPPKAVDVNVDQVHWHPQGLALTYTKSAGGGKAIGVYAVGSQEGDVVLKLGPKDRYESQWFENQTKAILIVYRDVVRAEVAMVEASVYIADASTGVSQLLWTQAFPGKNGIEIDVDTSPRLRHAIFRMKSGAVRFHMVLPVVGSRLIPSADLDRAGANGRSGPSWSVDGTAVYASNLATSESVPFTSKLLSTAVEQKVQLAHTESVALKLSGGMFWIAKPPTPAVGTAVLELMPSNAVLRNVRFKGEWQGRPGQASDLQLIVRPTNMMLGNSSFIANSLWLVRGKEFGQGVMTAAHVDKHWMSPVFSSVAYTTDGALIVRQFKT